MAPIMLATVEDLEVRLGAVLTDRNQAEARLLDASAIVRVYAGPVAKRWGADLDIPDDIPGVVANMVERCSRNPGGATQEQAGPFMRSFGAEASNRIYLTANEKAIVRAAAGRSSLTVIATGRGYDETYEGPLDTPSVIDPLAWPSEGDDVATNPFGS